MFSNDVPIRQAAARQSGNCIEVMKGIDLQHI
jgi:hypothetical protein